jgi:hypothetical protein
MPSDRKGSAWDDACVEVDIRSAETGHGADGVGNPFRVATPRLAAVDGKTSVTDLNIRSACVFARGPI